MFQTEVVDRIKTHFIFNNFFSENLSIYENMIKYCIAGHATADTMAHAHCMTHTKGDTHTHTHTHTHTQYVVMQQLTTWRTRIA
jgi:hypothetical protein